ncbi:YraN family protein [Aliivibrio kagoshimensis]|uniref:YraN family protein n=1 Tax=Aliivibrio kagoshimensis TaxID=2910230 RepID=UPI003D11AF30
MALLTKRDKGNHYESVAKHFLLRHNLTFIAHNFICKMGELDLIMKDSDTIVFIEVKYRDNRRYGSAEEMVHWKKQQRVKKAAFYWLKQNRISIEHASFRFDVIAIHDQGNDINWIKNAIVEG